MDSPPISTKTLSDPEVSGRGGFFIALHCILYNSPDHIVAALRLGERKYYIAMRISNKNPEELYFENDVSILARVVSVYKRESSNKTLGAS